MSNKQNQSSPPMPSMEDYIWRPAKRIDAAAIHMMLQAVDAVDDTESAGVLDDVERHFDDTWVDAKKDTLLGLMPDGTVAALGWVFVNPELEEKHKAYLWLEVHPDLLR